MKDIPIGDLKFLIDEIIQQRESKEKEKRRSFLVEFAKVALTPVVIALVGYFGTWTVNKQNRDNAQLIADKQIESAHILAEKQIEAAQIRSVQMEENANVRSKADRDVERLEQIKDVFKDIINEAEKYSTNAHDQDYTSLKVQISSLEAYGDQAIPFLVKIRDIFKKKTKTIADHVNETVLNILQASRANFIEHKFVGTASTPLNLRNRDLVEYNFNYSTFENVNLYQAQFNRSSLENVKFYNADLSGADFSEANLSQALFEAGTNLRNTNFSRAYLKDVKFIGCENLSEAKFSLPALLLLNADQNPLKTIDNETYLELLNHNITDQEHIKFIKRKHSEDAEKLNALLNKVGMKYDQLIEQLEKKIDQQNELKAVSSLNNGIGAEAGA